MLYWKKTVKFKLIQSYFSKMKRTLQNITDAEVLIILNDDFPVEDKFQLVMEKDSSRGWTSLHQAVERDASVEVISRLLEIGGKGLVMAKDFHGGTALQCLLRRRKKNISLAIVSKLVEIGGKDLVVDKDKNGMNALQWGCCKMTKKASVEVISKLIEVGGRDIVMERGNRFGYTALHYEVHRGIASVERILKLVEIGGTDLVMAKDRSGKTVLHIACRNHLVSHDVISKLIEIGGIKLVMETDDVERTALYSTYFGSFTIQFNDIFELLIKIGIQAKTGGEFEIGSLFNVAPKDVQEQIYRRWEELAPSLERVLGSLQQQPPILHASILGKAPANIIRNIATQFNCTLTQDSMNRYPIDVALNSGLKWNEGVDSIVGAMAVEQERPMIYVAAHHGLKWENHMKELVENNMEEIESGKDALTSLLPFMLAAAGYGSDLTSIYGLMVMSPGGNFGAINS